MKLQHFVIIFLVIMIPVVLVMSEYTSLQIDTLAMKTKYDTALLGATFDTMAAFELNTINSESSSVIGEEIRDLEAIISTFTNSLSSSMNITGVSDDYILSYVPAMVFTMYDGYYIYSVSENTGERELKPYVYYTKTYIYGSTNITIAFSLDNYVSIYGTYDGKDISAAGYLIVPSDLEISDEFAYVTSAKEDGSVVTKVIAPGVTSIVKYKGIEIGKEVIYENETVEQTKGITIDKEEQTTDAMMYYYEAAKFTELYNEVIRTLSLEQREILEITNTNDPEDETSMFMNEKINIIKESITKNLNAAIYNYEGAVAENYAMPQLNGEDWDKILNDISIIAFLKDIPIGSTRYNNYVVINSSTNQKYVSAKSIDFIAYDTTGKSLGYYHKITCDNLIENIKNGKKIIGYASVDFDRYKYSPNDEEKYYYYYKHNEYADYDCEVNTIKPVNVANIEDELGKKSLDTNTKNKVLKTYYTAVGRVRYRLIKASSYINTTDTSKQFKVKYNTNGGNWPNGGTEVRTVDSDNGRIRINQQEPRMTGYSFLGWALDNTSTLPDIKTGDTLYEDKYNKTLNLYAVFAKQYTVIYELNGGDWGANSIVQTKIKDVDYTIPKAQPTKQNYVFMGWSKNADLSTNDFPALGIEYTYSDNADLRLYAIWNEKQVTIKYFENGGTAVYPNPQYKRIFWNNTNSCCTNKRRI